MATLQDDLILTDVDLLQVGFEETVNNTTVNSGGILHVTDGGTANNTIVSANGCFKVFAGGTATIITVNPLGHLEISSGGTATDVIENGGFVYVDNDADVTFTPNSIDGLVLSESAEATIHSGTTANGATVNDGCFLRVYSGGTAVDVTIIGQGRLFVESGGTAVNAAVNGNYYESDSYNGGGISVGSGGTLIGATANPGNGITVLSGGTALEVRENGGGVAIDPKMKDPSAVTFVSNSFSGYVYDATVHSGTTANRIILDRTRIDIYSGGTASDTIASAGFIYISSGGYADSTTLKGRFHGAATIANPSMFIYSGGTAEHTYLAGIDYPPNRLSCGIMTLSGGTANHTTIVSGGLLTVSGGVASDVSINGHRCPWLENNYNPNNDDRFYGTMLVQGGTVTDVTVNNGGVLRVSWLNNGSMTGIVENGGYVSANPSKRLTFASNTFGRIALGKYESATAHSGTTAASVTLESGGLLDIFSSGKLTGRTFIRGGIVSAREGAVVEFDLTQTAPGAAARIDDLTGIKGTPTYVIAVNADQAQGVYVLAENASAIDVTLTCAEWDKPEDPKDEDDESCKLIVGQSMTIEGVQYTLALTDKTLSLTVGDEAAAAPSPYTTDGLALLSDKISVKKDEVYHDTVLFSGGILRIDDGGMADATTVNSGGSLMISSGGTATDIIENGGFVDVGSGAKATFASNVFRNSMLFGSVTLHSGTTAYNTRIAGDLFIYDGGVASGVACAHPTRNLPYDSYTVTVYSGGVLNDAEVVNSRCIVNVSSGGTANRVSLVYSGLSGYDYDSYSGSPLCGTMTVRQGTANSTTVAQGGTMEIIGGTVTDTYIRGGTVMMEKSKIDVGTANNTVIDGGIMKVGPSCALDGVRVNSGGSLLLNGTASAVNVVENGGFVSAINASSDTNISFLSNTFSGVELTSLMQKGATVHSGTTAVSTTINSQCVLSVYEGGVASGVLVNSRGSAIVMGGTANNVVINDRGIMRVDYVKGYDSTGRTSTILPTLNDVVVTSGGSLRITSAAEVNGLTVLQDAMFSISETKGTTFSRTILNDASITLGRDASATDTVLNGRSVLSAGYRATATSTTVNSGCRLITNKATVTSVTVASGGILDLRGGTATGIEMEAGARLGFTVASDAYVQGTSGGIEFETKDGSLSDCVIESGNSVTVNNGGKANSVTVNRGGYLFINYDATATDIEAEAGARLGFTVASSTYFQGTSAGIAIEMKDASLSDYAIDNGNSVGVENGGIANGITVNEGGALAIWEDGAANGITVNEGGYLCIYENGTAKGITVNEGGVFDIWEGGTANGITVRTGGNLAVAATGKLSGRMTFEEGAVLTIEDEAVVDFDLRQTETGAAALVNDLSVICGSVVYYSLTVNGDMMPGSHTIALADGAAEFNSTISVMNQAGAELGTLVLDETVTIGYNDYTLSLADGTLSVTVEAPDLTPQEPVGTTEKVSWETTGAEQYIVEYSTDNFEHVIQVVTTGNATETPGLPAGTYQWRVKSDTNSYWAVGEEIVSEPDPDETPKVVQSVEDGSDDIFFASTNGTWSRFYYAQHVGSIHDGWSGTNEVVSAEGKGRIQNLFFGSSDPNVLCLTDGENGDAIFVDDVYTDLPEGIEEHTARLYRIQEVRAGFGDDIVDMTSQRFEYFGEGLTIRGGDGDDVIWANKGDNTLFGDAGNDRIVGASGDDVIAGGIGNDRLHGGGGDDVFTFCENWGADTVEQLADGTVTLWFASGSEDNWNASTLTYTDGENSVKVSGVATENISLKFGDDDSDNLFVELSGMGAFDAFTSERIFEESGQGLLAGL